MHKTTVSSFFTWFVKNFTVGRFWLLVTIPLGISEIMSEFRIMGFQSEPIYGIRPHLKLGLWDYTPFEIGIMRLQPPPPLRGPWGRYTITRINSCLAIWRSSDNDQNFWSTQVMGLWVFNMTIQPYSTAHWQTRAYQMRSKCSWMSWLLGYRQPYHTSALGLFTREVGKQFV